jgi:hypothetical protein
MISRAWMLLAAALLSPAWSQEAAVVPPKVTPQSFDLRGASMQQLVRDTAATQYAPVLLVEEEPPPQKPAPIESMAFASPEDLSLIDPAPESRASAPAAAPVPAPAPLWFRILSGAVDSLLEPDEDLEFDAQYSARNACLAANRDKPTDQRNRSCQ